VFAERPSDGSIRALPPTSTDDADDAAGDGVVPSVTKREWAADEIALALHLAPMPATIRLAAAQRLAGVLRPTRDLLEAGRLCPSRAQLLTDMLVTYDDTVRNAAGAGSICIRRSTAWPPCPPTWAPRRPPPVSPGSRGWPVLRKERLSVPPFGIDLFDGPLAGVLIGEIEFDTVDQMDACRPPADVVRREITGDPAWRARRWPVTIRFASPRRWRPSTGTDRDAGKGRFWLGAGAAAGR
jgi:hypothetical protein